MGSLNNGRDLNIEVLSRRLMKASDCSIQPHVLSVSNFDLLTQPNPVSILCVYPKPRTGEFSAVVAAFEAGLPSFLNHFFPLAGRLATNPSSGLPEVHCHNQGAELVVGEAGVALASLDYSTTSASAGRIQLPCGMDDMALSVQLVSFACGGFTVAWRTNYVLADGSAVALLVSAWSELARSGTLAAGSRPNHDRTVFRPRAPPSYSPLIDDAFTPLDPNRQVNVLTYEQSFVERLYYIDASDIARLREAASRDGVHATPVQAVSAYLWKTLASVVGTADTRCRMGWWVDGRQRLTAPASMRNYVGNVITVVLREADVQEVLRMPLADVAAMVRETITAPDYDEHFQELVDWAEVHKTQRYVETGSIGLGSPTVWVTSATSFRLDTDFGFGHAVAALPTSESSVRLCTGFVQIISRPGGDGSWMASGFFWPCLAAALDSDEPHVSKPVTAEYLGLSAPKVQRCRL